MRQALLPLALVGLFTLLPAHHSAAEERKLLVEFGTPLELKEYGGPNMDVILRRDQPTSFSVLFIDHDNLVPRATISTRDFPEVDQFYATDIKMVPTITKEVIKKEAAEDAGGLSKLYPVFESGSGDFQLFLHDTLAVAPNKRQFVIRTTEDG